MNNSKSTTKKLNANHYPTMKHFFKNVLSTVVGIFVAMALLSLLGLFSIFGIAAISSAPSQVDDNSVLMLDLKGSINERSQEDPWSAIIGNDAMQSQGLDDIITAISMAKDEKKVKGIYIKAGTFTGAHPATLKAIRRALTDFKKSGKFVVAYGDTYTQGAYYICSVADSVLKNPQGMIDWCGLSSQVVYYKDLLDKIGVEMQIVKVGTYKSAVEPYILNEMSEANREQISTYCSETWNEMVMDVSKSRKLSADKLNALADSSMLMRGANTYKTSKLVDKLAYSDQVSNTIAAMMGKDSEEDYHIVKVSDMVQKASSTPKGLGGKAVAVYYAVGNIVNEPSGSFSSEDEIAGSKVIKDLKELADNDDIKAVVLRVNSGGGSAYASEQIWHQVMNIKAKKPIVVSMGDLAASGGYYISCAADYIYAEPTTLTGSIGIFGMFPNAGKLLNDKLGVHFSTVKTNAMSDFGDVTRAFTPEERAMAQAYINKGYDLFTRRCADGRKMHQNEIKAIGEGRIWTGAHAQKIGLVDELGSLNDAIEKAKKLAKIDDATVMVYPAKTSTLEGILGSLTESSITDSKMQEALGEYYNVFSEIKNANKKTGLQASMPYSLILNL